MGMPDLDTLKIIDFYRGIPLKNIWLGDRYMNSKGGLPGTHTDIWWYILVFELHFLPYNLPV